MHLVTDVIFILLEKLHRKLSLPHFKSKKDKREISKITKDDSALPNQDTSSSFLSGGIICLVISILDFIYYSW
jgi:hypothetical protein